jgi:hypothetical protein
MKCEGYKYKVNGKTVCGGECELIGDRLSLFPKCRQCVLLDKGAHNGTIQQKQGSAR